MVGGERVFEVSTGRNRYVDFLRITAIGFVVLGHWLVTSVTYHSGQFQGADVLAKLAALFAPFVAALGPLERRRGRPRAVPDVAAAPRLAAPPLWALSLLGAGIPFVAYGLSRFAVRGFAPGGQLPGNVLASYFVGVLLILIASMGSSASQPGPRQPHREPVARGPTAAPPERRG